jgi:molybdate transport system substrate-binding protein
VRRRVSVFLLPLCLLFGCGRPAQQASRELVSLNVYVPCQLSAPIQRAIGRFQETHPHYKIQALVDKPLAQLASLGSSRQASGVVITLGEVEMGTLVASGVVAQADLKPFAQNIHPLVAIAPAATAKPASLKEIASVHRVFIEDPAKSTLGARTTQALQAAGLWNALESKVVRPQPDANVLAEMLSGKADAAFVMQGCLLAETGGSIPKTIRIVGALEQKNYPPIVHQAAPLKTGKDYEAAVVFVDFLLSPEGQQVLKETGLTPVSA